MTVPDQGARRMIRIVLHRMDGVAEIAWAGENVAEADEIQREVISLFENRQEIYKSMPERTGRPVLHFEQTGERSGGS